MIVGHIDHPERAAALHPGIARAFERIADLDLGAQGLGRLEFDGERLYINFDQDPGRGREGARLEFHRRYIDVQIVLEGTELIGWRPVADCSAIDEPYDPARDAGFYADEPVAWIALTPGAFAVFTPDDAHAPLAGEGVVRKAIVKVLVDG